jgi:hypothetical protein
MKPCPVPAAAPAPPADAAGLAARCEANGLALAWSLFPDELRAAATAAAARRARLDPLLRQLGVTSPAAGILDPEPPR